MSAPLAADLACILARLEQINSEQEPAHWLWDRVMTCDVPRLRHHLAALDAYLAAESTRYQEGRAGSARRYPRERQGDSLAARGFG